jgi:cytochrome c oxidase assembly factor CtaG
VTAHDLLFAWTWRPGVAAILAAAVAVYLASVRPLRLGRTLALFGATGAVVLALLSPIDALARGTLFSAHMLQHMLLALVAPPLALLALPPTSHATEPRRNLALATWALGVGAMWFWHAPALCNAAATSDAVRALQNLSLLALGGAFWWPVLGPTWRLPDLTAVAYLFTACLACSILGISIAFSPVTVCAAYGHAADPLGALPLVRGWGLTPSVDQQIGGLLMWVPGCTLYAGAILTVVGRFYGAAHVKTEAT